MPIQMALRPKARICGAYPAIGYGRINVFGHSQEKKEKENAMLPYFTAFVWFSDPKGIR